MRHIQDERKSKLFNNPWPPSFFQPNCPCCAIGDKVLIWAVDSNSDFSNAPSGYSDVATSYQSWVTVGGPPITVSYFTATDDAGLTLDDLDINQYRVIIFPMPVSDPIWWDAVTGADATWTGRLFILGEWGSGGIGGNTFEDINNYIISKTSLTGITYHILNINPGCGSVGNVTSDPLMDGMSGTFPQEINFALSSAVSGGSSLITDSGWTICARNRPTDSKVEYVICGDNNLINDNCGHAEFTIPQTNNVIFLWNLWSVPL